MTSKEFITEVVQKDFPDIEAEKIIEQSYLIQYLIYKMRSVGKSSKARGSYGSIYPIYTLVEDYVNKGFDKNGKYKDYEGAIFTEIFSRQRELPFGEKLQNHGFNNRVNDDFRKYFARYNINDVPIIRNLETQRYWINENLLILDIDGQKINIAKSIMNITEKYIELKIGKFNTFFKNCNYFKNNYLSKEKEAIDFIRKQLNPDVDARIFEIVSFCILKYYYLPKKVYIGFSKNKTKEQNLILYKTGRTNANDGGVDFIMKPIGRIYQVTEVLDFKKYFLDIDKLNKFPITFVVKINKNPEEVMEIIKKDAYNNYEDEEVVKRYIRCFEEIITIPTLLSRLSIVIENELLGKMLDELVFQCMVEYNITDIN
ncbi:hypothetical protein [Tepidimicrobium xylanilyticum]